MKNNLNIDQRNILYINKINRYLSYEISSYCTKYIIIIYLFFFNFFPLVYSDLGELIKIQILIHEYAAVILLTPKKKIIQQFLYGIKKNNLCLFLQKKSGERNVYGLYL